LHEIYHNWRAGVPGGVPTRHKHKYRTAYTRGIYTGYSREYTHKHTQTQTHAQRSPSKVRCGLVISYRPCGHRSYDIIYRNAQPRKLQYHSTLFAVVRLGLSSPWAALAGPCWVQAWSVAHQSTALRGCRRESWGATCSVELEGFSIK